ncbi:MAG: hypothetical protein SOW08_13145 [Lachnospiraceae bacterium]|nr:hypothetical protein [Lachnospiraceae bacterium]
MPLLIMKNKVSDNNTSLSLYRGNVISRQREITANISIPKTFLSVKKTISYFRRKTIHLQEFFLIHLQLIMRNSGNQFFSAELLLLNLIDRFFQSLSHFVKVLTYRLKFILPAIDDAVVKITVPNFMDAIFQNVKGASIF